MNFGKINEFLNNIWLICLNNFYDFINHFCYTIELPPKILKFFFLVMPMIYMLKVMLKKSKGGHDFQ